VDFGLSALLLGAAFTTIKGLLGVVIGVGALIFFHELGHFLAAKWAGVRVEVFSLGFGHRLAGFKHGDTDYRISALPLGGYVRMLGQADEDPGQAPTDREDDFRNKTVGQRFVILAAGVVANLILAAVGFVAVFGLGISFDAPEVGRIMPASAAAKADLRSGDVILKIGEDEVLGWHDLQMLVALADGEVPIEVLRDGAVHTTRATPRREAGQGFALLGVAPREVVHDLTEESGLRAAGVRPASPESVDRILDISPVDSRCAPGQEMTPEERERVLATARGPVALRLERIRVDAGTGRPLGSERLEVVAELPEVPVFTLGLEIPEHAWVREVAAGSAAERAGVLPGDRVVAIGDVEPITTGNLKDAVRRAGSRSGGGPVPVIVERRAAEGDAPARHELSVTLGLENEAVVAAALAEAATDEERLRIREELGNWLFGVSYRSDVVAAPCLLPLADPDAEPVELQPGDRLLSVWLSGGLFWSDRADFPGARFLEQNVLRYRKDAPLRISWQPRGTRDVRTAVVKPFADPARTRLELGAVFGARKILVERGPIAAIALGMHETLIQTERLLLTLRSFFTGSVSPRELGGPIMIVQTSYAVATQDSLARLLHLLAILSVNLAVINILPIPVLDGGHIFFLLIEKLKGRPVSTEVLIYAQWVGLFCILSLLALVFFNDIRRIVQ